NLTRRELLRGVAHMGLAGSIVPLTGFSEMDLQQDGLILSENQKPGTTDWQLTFTRARDFRSELIEGYCSHTSIRAGEKMDIFISANPATEVNIDFYRMGYYGGKGGRHLKKLGPFSINPQPTPPIAEHRLRSCHWELATSLVIPEDWLSGVYLGKLSCSDHRYQSYIV